MIQDQGMTEILYLPKKNLTSLPPTISHIGNKSLISAIFPSDLTRCKVTCLFKAGDRKQPGK